MVVAHLSKRFCRWQCKNAYNKTHGTKGQGGANCRQCGNWFTRGPGQNAKSVCSAECRRARLAQSVRKFHERRPAMEQIYRQRQREKNLPDGNLIRFYRWNPLAPRKCEACGEHRVLEIAHKPDHPRLGSHRGRANCAWPLMVWVLCPTCHRLLDRMNYSPEELGLT